MKLLMLTWTDFFEGTGKLFEAIFKGMYALGHIPNVFMGGFVVFLLAFWVTRLIKYKKEALRNGTIE